MQEQFDFVFVDADKSNYINYYDFCIEHKLVRPKGWMLFDNTLWKGKVVDLLANTHANTHAHANVNREAIDRNTAHVHAFNVHVRDDARTRQTVLPVRDGMTLIHVL